MNFRQETIKKLTDALIECPSDQRPMALLNTAAVLLIGTGATPDEIRAEFQKCLNELDKWVHEEQPS